MKAKLSLLVSLLLLLVASPGPVLGQDKEEITALISDPSNQYWKSFEEGLKASSKSLGIPVNIHSLPKATDAETQLNQCEASLLKSPKVILFAAVNGINLASCLKKANDKGIVLIDVDGNVDEALAEKMGVKVAFSVASNNYDLGQKAAKYLNGTSGKVVVLEGLSGSQPNELRIKGFKENLPKDLTIVASQPGDWDRLKGYDIVSRLVLLHPDLAVVFAANDTMALGAVEALKAAGKSSVKVVGIDGSADAVRSIKQGGISASIAQLPYLMAQGSVAKAIEFLKTGVMTPFHQYVPILTLEKSVFDSNTEPLLKYLR